MAGKDQLVVMGQLSIGDGETKFIEDLATSIPSPAVLEKLIETSTQLLQTTLKQYIIDMVEQAAKPLLDANIIIRK